MEFIEQHLRFVVLHWIRCLSLFGTLAVFGTGGSARLAKVGLGVMLGTILSFTGDPASFDDPGVSPWLAALAVKEFLLGAVFGYVANLLFAILQMAGTLVGEEMGFNMSQVQDPLTGVSVQVMAHVYESLSIAVFFVAGGPSFVVRMLARSFQSYAVDEMSLTGDLLVAVSTYTGGIFLAALEIAAPVFIAMFVVGVVLGVLAKIAPEMHIMDLAFPLKVGSGLILVLATMPVLLPAIEELFESWASFMTDLAGRR